MYDRLAGSTGEHGERQHDRTRYSKIQQDAKRFSSCSKEQKENLKMDIDKKIDHIKEWYGGIEVYKVFYIRQRRQHQRSDRSWSTCTGCTCTDHRPKMYQDAKDAEKDVRCCTLSKDVLLLFIFKIELRWCRHFKKRKIKRVIENLDPDLSDHRCRPSGHHTKSVRHFVHYDGKYIPCTTIIKDL